MSIAPQISSPTQIGTQSSERTSTMNGTKR